jgi:predicted DNA-binding protein (MmcQ/YjbR family)
MDVDSIRAYCLSFAGTSEKLQWGDALCFKVGKKMFAVLGLDRLRLTFKCTPDTFAELIERDNIRPAPYVGRYQWVALDRLDALPDADLEDLIRQSFEMVLTKAGKPPRHKKAPREKTSEASRSRAKAGAAMRRRSSRKPKSS